jgi:hypothetical protein
MLNTTGRYRGGPGRKSKGDRVLIQSRVERLVAESIAARAAARDISISQYVADLLAIHDGHPELVRELDQEVMPLAM